jgi:hypothetical protein
MVLSQGFPYKKYISSVSTYVIYGLKLGHN